MATVRRIATGIACVIAAAAPASAARQSGIAGASRGTIAITVSVAGQARIGRLADVTADRDSSSQPVCLSSNTATRGIAIVAAGDGSAGGFVADRGGRPVDYAVHWVGATAQTMVPGRPIVEHVGLICDPASAPRLVVANAAGGALSLLVAPE